MKPSSLEAYQLMHDGSLALSLIEANGIRINTDYLEKAIEKVDKSIKGYEIALREDKEVFPIWRKHYGQRTNLGSRDQLAYVLFKLMGFESKHVTASGRDKGDKSALESVDLQFARDYLQAEKLKKAKSTYLLGIQAEVVDGFAHVNYNLHTTKTFRGSCDNFNFQNLPVRDPAMAEIIRNCFIARNDNYQLVETDYSGIEVKVTACYNKDPVLISYIKDTTKDMHRDMAAQCFKLKPSQVTKNVRYCGKNMFVFPQFYGDYFINNALALWEAIARMKLETTEGVGLYDHLASNGIESLGDCDPKEPAVPGTFEHHLKQVERDFWKRRFKVYDAWKDKWFKMYLNQGYVETYTGFVVQGLYSRNEIINSPIQGDAFHCLLWCIIRLNKLLKKKKMRSKVVGQIHDSIVADVHKKELDDYLQMVKKVMTVDLPKVWKWIIVPLEIEAEVAPLGGTWHQKKKVEI